MCKGPVCQYANYIDEGIERANDSQSLKCFYCPRARADPLTPFDDPQAKGLLSRGQRARPCAGQKERRCYGNSSGRRMARCGNQEERGQFGWTAVVGCCSTCLRCIRWPRGKMFPGVVVSFSNHPNMISCKLQGF